MATFVLTDATLTVGGTDLSDHIRCISLDYGAELQDDTVMGDTTRSVAGGLMTWAFTVEWLQDYAVGEVDATLFSLVGTSVALVGKPTSASVSTTNPSYSGSGILGSYNPMGGGVGDQATASTVFTAAGPLTRATS